MFAGATWAGLSKRRNAPSRGVSRFRPATTSNGAASTRTRFALSGGVFLLKLLGYNFSVAVWVGFIALFGTAVQTGVVMVIYLEEAVERKRVAMGVLIVQALHEAVMEGALLRLRLKIMHVSTVVAGLLPIMWSS